MFRALPHANLDRLIVIPSADRQWITVAEQMGFAAVLLDWGKRNACCQVGWTSKLGSKDSIVLKTSMALIR